MPSQIPQNERIIFDTRILPHLMPYVLVSVVIALLAYALPIGETLFLPLLRNGNERLAFVVATFVVHEFLWCLNALFVVFDRWHLLTAFKIVRPKSAGESPSNDLLVRSIKQQLVSHLVTQVIALYFLYDLFVRNGSTWKPIYNDDESSTTNNKVWLLAVKVFIATIVNDALFFGFHVLMHAVPLLYRRIHSVHHGKSSLLMMNEVF